MNGHSATAAGKLAVLPTAKTKKKSSKTSTKKKTLIIPRKTLAKMGVVLLSVGLLAAAFFGYQKTYADKIYPKIMIAGQKTGGLTPTEAKLALQKIAASLNEQGPEITYENQTLKPTLSEMGVTFNIEEAVSEAFDFGRKGSWKDRISEHWQILIHQHQITISPQIDEAKFNAYLGQLARVAEKEPVNASLAIKNGTVVLISSEKGRGLDKEKLKNDIEDFINSGKNGNIVMKSSDLSPKINEEGTLAAKAAAEKYLAAAPLTVTFPSGLGPAETDETNSWTAERAEIGSWIKFSESDNELSASVSPNAFVNWIAKQVEIAAQDREIEDGTGNVLSEGQDGRGADTNTLTAQIRDALGKGQPGSFVLGVFAIPRGEKIIYPHAQPGRFGGKYIDINLSEQTLYAFEGSTLVNQFLISSGKRGYGTPTGEFAVYSKNASTLMDGPDYYLPNVPWVSWFLGDYSIHGTYWHHNFGHPMSHGCVNASTPDAEWLYGWDDIGTPVYVHY